MERERSETWKSAATQRILLGYSFLTLSKRPCCLNQEERVSVSLSNCLLTLLISSSPPEAPEPTFSSLRVPFGSRVNFEGNSMVLGRCPEDYVCSLATLVRLPLQSTVPLNREPVRCERLQNQILNILYRSPYSNVSVFGQASFSTDSDKSTIANKSLVAST